MKKVLGLFFVLFWIGGCAQKVHLDHTPQSMPPLAKQRPRVLILPFATYIPQGNFFEWLRTNAMFYEGVSDGFIKLGMMPLPFEETLWLCKQNGYINLSFRKPKISKSLIEVLNDPEFSESMKTEIRKLIRLEMRKKGYVSFNANPLLKLTEDNLWSLAQQTHARYVVRGRITEFYIREEDTLNPFKVGFLASPFRLASRSLYGRPAEEKWGLFQEASLGLGVGALIGSEAHAPFEPPREETIHIGHPLLGTAITKKGGGAEDYDIGNALVWGAAGAGLALLANYGGRSPEAVIGFALYVYDVKKKDLIWANRVRVRVTPESVWAPAHPEDLFFRGIETASQILMDCFGKDLKARSKLQLASVPQTSSPGRSGQEIVQKAEQAAERSEKAAQRAEKAATKAERIFEKMLTK